ncbi:uncharacterized protein LOC105694961 [Orussus abietinus]|uniref:uncharacterized protein LOC105694961 n=1 Tax=Orussus abietinus TaxID=222816 RepID=UPI000626B19B|nr:uncharacterized protein LOC105694961 [Orussus abietinus]XP_012271549.1 uncharacterized protein LOC105694961 [Orussus abietinus]
MAIRMLMILILTSSTRLIHAHTGGWEKCGGRLERALEALHRESTRRNRLEEEEGIAYQHELRSAPLDMTVSHVAVKLPQDLTVRGGPWAQVERCVYEPENNSLQTRLIFNDLSVSGLVSMLPRDFHVPMPAESCRMTLRLRRAGMEFYTSPIARGKGQMRIRTESSFLEPRFVSIYAYGCRPTRLDKQIKRQDKWPPHHPLSLQQDIGLDLGEIPVPLGDPYDPPEPRELAAASKEEDLAVANENRHSRALLTPEAKLGIWRKSTWITKIRRRRSTKSELPRNLIVRLIESRSPVDDGIKTKRSSTSSSKPFDTVDETGSNEDPFGVSKLLKLWNRNERSTEDITPRDFAAALARKSSKHMVDVLNSTITLHNVSRTQDGIKDLTENSSSKNNFKRETTTTPLIEYPREGRNLPIKEDAVPLHLDLDSHSRDWQLGEEIAREMEDVFLRGASQALTRYIERQLHPAIKETLMLSMGYTISYG